MAYAFDFIRPDGGIDHVQLGYFPTDKEAVLSARAALAEHAGAVAIEVWDRDRRVAQVKGGPRA